MIFRRYGTTLHSVETNFDSRALTEIGFRRDRGSQIPVEDFESSYEKVEEHELAATAQGDVHDEVEQAVLAKLESALTALLEGLDDDSILVVESEQGVDHPKTRASQKNVVVEGQNRLHFTVRVDPPLRIGIYRARG